MRAAKRVSNHKCSSVARHNKKRKKRNNRKHAVFEMYGESMKACSCPTGMKDNADLKNMHATAEQRHERKNKRLN